MNIRYTGVVTIIVSIALVAAILSRDASNQALRARHERWFFGEVPADAINSVTVTGPGNGSKAVLLEKVDGVWRTADGGHLVDPNTILPVIQAVGQQTKGRLRSVNPAKSNNFGVSKEMGINLQFGDDTRRSLNYVVGSTGPDLRSTYVRVLSENDTYLVDRALQYLLENRYTVNDWRDKRLVPERAEAITALTIRDGSTTLTLKKSGQAWELEGQGPVHDNAAVDALMSSIINLHAANYMAADGRSDADMGLSNPMMTITATTAGKTHDLVIGEVPPGGAQDSIAVRVGGRNGYLATLSMFYVRDRVRVAMRRVTDSFLSAVAAPAAQEQAPASDAAPAEAPTQEQGPS